MTEEKQLNIQTDALLETLPDHFPKPGEPRYDPGLDSLADDIFKRPIYFDRQGRPLTRRNYYRLNGHRPYKRVAETTVGKYWISTVWLGMDHGFDGITILIFETMVFNHSDEDEEIKEIEIPGTDKKLTTSSKWADLDCRRYETEEQAIIGHREMVEEVKLIEALEIPEILQGE